MARRRAPFVVRRVVTPGDPEPIPRSAPERPVPIPWEAMRNGVQLLGLAAVLLTVSCHALGTARGLAVVAALVTGALAWIAHRGHARAGGGTGDTGSTTDAGTTGSSTSSSTDSGTSDSTGADAGTLDSTASAGTAEPTSTTSATADEGFETSACLSITPPEESGPCACEIDDDRDATDWAPALLLPAVALRRRSRRASLDRIAADGRLPEDVVARLRQRMDADHPK
jgi:hypothetical protein